MADTDVMTVRELAEYLKVKERTIYRLVAQGDVPAFKVGGPGVSEKEKSINGRNRMPSGRTTQRKEQNRMNDCPNDVRDVPSMVDLPVSGPSRLGMTDWT